MNFSFIKSSTGLKLRGAGSPGLPWILLRLPQISAGSRNLLVAFEEIIGLPEKKKFQALLSSIFSAWKINWEVLNVCGEARRTRSTYVTKSIMLTFFTLSCLWMYHAKNVPSLQKWSMFVLLLSTHQCSWEINQKMWIKNTFIWCNKKIASKP